MRGGIGSILAIALAATPLQAQPPGITESAVGDRTGTNVKWQRDEASREETAPAVRKLLGKPLTVSSAVQIALLNNRNLQATFEEIGIAQANVLEAVTVPNPSIEFDVQFPFMAGTLNRYGWLVAQEFVQILMIPLKKKISEEALQAAELRVADQVLELVAEVKKDYFTIQADQQLIGRLQLIQETSAAALDLAQKQFKAGNITELALLQMQSTYSEGRLGIAEAKSDLDEHREKFNELLGLWGPQTDWEIKGELPGVRAEDFSTSRLESLAVAQRLDLRAAQKEVSSLASALGLTKTFRWVPVLDFGFSGERDIDGALNMGPQFRIELPVFNQGQSRVAHGQSELRRSSAKLEALAVGVRSQTRRYRDKLASLAERASFYHDDVLPTRIRIVNRSLLQYNAMQISPYELFTAKADELRSERGYIDTLRDYWITRAELERTVGGTLNPHQAASPDKAVAATTPKKDKP